MDLLYIKKEIFVIIFMEWKHLKGLKSPTFFFFLNILELVSSVLENRENSLSPK